MNARILTPLVFSVFLASAGSVQAAEGSITIKTPADGATVSQDADTEVAYSATLGPNGDHLHIYLDNKRIDVLHQLEGKADVGYIPPGEHKICIAENTRSHVATGVETCISVTSK